MFVYSPRPGTPAAAMDGQVDPAVAAERFARLADLQQRMSLAPNQELVGREVEVLTEGPSRKDPAGGHHPHPHQQGGAPPRRLPAGAPSSTWSDRAGRPQPPDGEAGP